MPLMIWSLFFHARNRPTEGVSGGADGQGWLIEMCARQQDAGVGGAIAPSAARGVRRVLLYFALIAWFSASIVSGTPI